MMANMTVERPESSKALCDLIAEAAAAGTQIEIRGGASKAAISRPDRPMVQVDMRGFAGVIDYDPAELVLTAGAGTPLAEIKALLATRGQMLAFDPFDHGVILGGEPGAATIGGVLAAGVSGPRRLSAGSARDHFLGFHGVSGRGEAFVGGAKVVKNVTGYDLPKLMAGAWGQLAAMTEVTVKVMPRPAISRTLRLSGLTDRQAHEVMAQILSSPAEAAAAAHLPAGIGSDDDATLFRLEGIRASVDARLAAIQSLVGPYMAMDIPDEADAERLWDAIKHATPLAHAHSVWRVLAPAAQGWQVMDALNPMGAQGFYDWAGGLVWIGLPELADPAMIHQMARSLGGHAMLVRGDAALRAMAALHTARAPAVAALEARVRSAFDPAAILHPHRFEARDAN